MKNIITLLAIFISSACLVCQSYAEPNTADNTAKKIIFLTADDLHHVSGTHEFHAGALLLKKSIESSEIADDVSCEVYNNWPEDPSVFQDADVIVHYYKGNKAHLMNKNNELFDTLAKKGVSQMFIHYAVDPDSECEACLKSWTGAVYKDKFSTNPHWNLKSELENHPINNGVQTYESYDEWYVNMDFESELKKDYEKPETVGDVYSVMHGNNEDFQKGKGVRKAYKREMSCSELTVFWAKERQDGGRGVGITGAHYHKNWANDNFRKQVLNAVVWSAKLDVPKEGVKSPAITNKMINENLDARKRGGLKVISLDADKEAAPNNKPAKKAATKPAKKPAKKQKDIYKTKKVVKSTIQSIHPFFSLENINLKGSQALKIGGMCFDGDVLYVATLKPDRTDKFPDHAGQVLRVENVFLADGTKSEIKITPIVSGLYEPCAIAIVADNIYVGTKTQILRFDGGTKTEKVLNPKDATVMIDGLSTINFHTYTIGFEEYTKDGQLYLCGNFTTAVLRGGKRDHMVPPNADVNRGSTFIFGPVTGDESPSDIKLEYLAGGFRTPNGIEVGPDNEVYVTDNQGIFNPSNELTRLEKGSFYGHYLYTENGKEAAFQPLDINSENGGAIGQKATTVHLPQGSVARSPAQPHVIRDRKGVLAPYNGQILLCEFTTGSMLRVFTEQVGGVWQGVAFKHSGGFPDKDGNGGFTGGPNRIEQGSDGNYYIGQIGAGGLWTFNGASHGLQRFRVKSQKEIASDFNEMLAVRVVDGGFEIEFLKPVDPSDFDASQIAISQWTYIPTSGYGGTPKGTQKLKVKKISFDASNKKATLLIDGLKDMSEKYVLKEKGYTSDNTGWVVHVKLDPKMKATSKLYTKEFWYTLHQKIGGKEVSASAGQLTAYEKATEKYQSLCSACHVAIGDTWLAPDLKGILGRKQTVIRDGKEEVVTVDRDYIINAILNPESEKVVKYKDGIMAQLGISKEEAESLADYIIQLK